MIVIMNDGWDTEEQRIVRDVRVLPSAAHNTIVHDIVGFVYGCRGPEWGGLWLIYCGY